MERKVICNVTEEEVAKSFIEDVEQVKEHLPRRKNIFCIWHGNKNWTLTNYKAPWNENGVKPQFFIRTNGAKRRNGDTCFDLSIAFMWWIFNYTNFDLQGRKKQSGTNKRG